MTPKKYKMFATCPAGLEPVLHEEIKGFKFSKVESQVGGVQFEGPLVDLYRANLELRTAFRVLVETLRFSCPDEETFVAKASEIDWSQYLRLDNTFAISARVNHPKISHSQYLSRKLKDVLVDYWKVRLGKRPSVDPENPDVQLHIYLNPKYCTISLDSSFPSLFQRGYRQMTLEAPLNEAMAASLVFASGWDRRAPLIDPLCGSGTILIEAALMALDRAPGLMGRDFGFQRWPSFEPQTWDKAREMSRRAAPKGKMPTLLGFDQNRGAIKIAKINAKAAGVEKFINFETQDISKLSLRKGWNGWIVSNPPYGERLKDDKLFAFYRGMGEVLKHHEGYRAALLTGYKRAAEALSLPVKEDLLFKNGGISCNLLQFDL